MRLFRLFTIPPVTTPPSFFFFSWNNKEFENAGFCFVFLNLYLWFDYVTTTFGQLENEIATMIGF